MDFTPQFRTLTRCLVERGLFLDQPFTLIDVGCGGGLAPLWRFFEPSLRALGVDPMTAECARLQAAEKNSGVRYAAAFLRLPPDHPFRLARGEREPWTANPWTRTSSAEAMDILARRLDAEKKLAQLNAWNDAPLVAPSRTLTLDALAVEQGFPVADFLKLDVDGPDLEVLHSAENLIRRAPLLGLVMEVNFYGSDDPTDHTFHATDRLLRSWGFELFDLTTRRCSVSALPGPFRHEDSPYETLHGRIIQGEALYLRDPCGWDKHPAARVPLTPHHLLKLACLFELFNAPDHAAELLAAHAAELAPLAEVRPLLHLLAHEIDPSLDNYDTLLERFRSDPTSHYPSRWPRRTTRSD